MSDTYSKLYDVKFYFPKEYEMHHRDVMRDALGDIESCCFHRLTLNGVELVWRSLTKEDVKKLVGLLSALKLNQSYYRAELSELQITQLPWPTTPKASKSSKKNGKRARSAT